MPPASSLPQDPSWKRLLLSDPIDPRTRRDLSPRLQAIGRDALQALEAEATPGEVDAADRWYASATGQETLAALTLALWQDMAAQSAHAMPAHDARHAMFKVPAASLLHMAAEQVTGWERTGILGALMHDYGRWAEERFYGGPQRGVLHARMSFLLGRELMSDYELPDLIRRHVLLAVIRHSSGAVAEDPMPLKLTVSADRDQLYGPEIVLRIAHHSVNAQGDFGSWYGERPGLSVLDQLGIFLVNRLPGPLFARQPHVDGLHEVLMTFLLMAEPADASRSRFVRMQADSARRGFAGPLQEGRSWERAWHEASALRPVAGDPQAQLLALLAADHVTRNIDYQRKALDKMRGLDEQLAPLLAGALAHVERERGRLDAIERAQLEALAAMEQGDRFVTTLAGLLLRG